MKRAKPRFVLEETIMFVYIHNATRETTGAAAQKRENKKSQEAKKQKRFYINTRQVWDGHGLGATRRWRKKTS
jgi:hypothetical protein